MQDDTHLGFRFSTRRRASLTFAGTGLAAAEFAYRWQVRNGLILFEVIAEPCCECRLPYRPSGLQPRPIIIHPNEEIRTFPLLSV
jgi:hypothetical protein